MVDTLQDVKKGCYDCSILQIQNLVGDIYLMRMHCPSIAQHILPGQFLNIKVNNELIPLLRKPFSVCRRSVQEGWIEVLWKIIGKGTQIMAEYKVGDRINILGPLGIGFKIPPNLQRAYLVAGGIGVAPFPLLGEILVETGAAVEAVLGARTSTDLSCVEEFKKMGADVHVATEDGAIGYRGLVTDLLKQRLELQGSEEGSHLFSCGPVGFLQAMLRITEQYGIEGQVSLETMMGCGFGICVGCPVEIKNPPGHEKRYKLTCIEGPVFNTRDVILHD